MRNLSVMEQKQVVGGYWCVKVYKYSDGNYLRKYYFNTMSEAEHEVDYWNGKSNYHAIMIEIR